MAELVPDKPDWPPIAPYRALALQLTARAVNRLGAAEAREAIRASIGRVAAQVRASCAFIGPDCRLVSFQKIKSAISHLYLISLI